MARPALFQTMRIRNLALANRIVLAPMCQYSARDGLMNDWHVIHLGHLALSGAALITIEATAVLLARTILYDSRWPWHAAAALGGQVRAPKQYLRSQPWQFKHLFGETGPVSPEPMWMDGEGLRISLEDE